MGLTGHPEKRRQNNHFDNSSSRRSRSSGQLNWNIGSWIDVGARFLSLHQVKIWLWVLFGNSFEP